MIYRLCRLLPRVSSASEKTLTAVSLSGSANSLAES